MKKFIAKLWSYSLIFPITDDNNFGTNDLKENASYRISLLGLFWGHIALYLITYNFTEKKFSIYHKITLESCKPYQDKFGKKSIEDRISSDIKHLKQKPPNPNLDIELEFIQYSNNRQKERTELGERKINLYTTVMLAAVPILLALFDINVFLNYTIWEKVIAIYVIYFLLNVLLLIFDSMSVKSYEYSKFSDLKNSNNQKEQLRKNYYFDWQHNQSSAELRISYVLNIQTLIKYALVLAVILTLSINLRSVYSADTHKKNSNISSNVITVELSSLDNPYSIDSIKMTKLQLDIQENRCNKVIVLIPKQDLQDAVMPFFNKYHKHTITYILDDTLLEDTVKIIKE